MNSENKTNVYVDYFAFRKVEIPSDVDCVIPVYLKKALPSNQNAAILDIGCGYGHTLRGLRSEGYLSVMGIDVSEDAVKQCKIDGLNVEKVTDIVEYCRKASKRFDFIIMSHVLEHIEKTDIIESLTSIRTMLLKNGGRLIVITPNAQSNTGCYWAYEDFTHTTIFTAGSLYFVLKCAGFHNIEFVDKCGTSGSHPILACVKRMLLTIYKLKLYLWNRITSSSFHQQSPQIFTYDIKVIAS